MAEETTTTTGSAAPAAWPAGAKFKLGDHVLAELARATGVVTGAKLGSSHIVYEIRYDVGGNLGTWFDYQLKAAPAKGGGA